MEIAPPRATGRVYAGNSASGNARVQYGDIHGNVTYNVYEVRQEQIGIEASISGLRSLTNSIHTSLYHLKPDHVVRPNVIAGLSNEVNFSKTSLDALNYKLSWLHNAPEQAALVKLDQLVILLANAIVLFDRLRTSLGSTIETKSADDNGLHVFLPQLQEHNMAWKLQLELMDRHTTAESDAIASNLDSATNKLLRENADLKRRMDAFQSQLDQMSKQITSSAASICLDSGSSSSSSLAGDTDDESVHSAASSFEETLNSSWVYRRNEHRSEVMSIDTSLQRDYAWSEMSELTLANKSALSVLALPIDISELAHGDWYSSRARATPLSSIPVEVDIESLATGGPEAWSQLKDDQIEIVIEQLMRKGTRLESDNVRLKLPERSIRRVRDAAYSLGLGKRNNLERDAIKILGDQDYRSLRQCWAKYDPRFFMFISKEAFPRFMGDLPESFGFRVYPEAYTVPDLLLSSHNPRKDGRALALGTLWRADLDDDASKAMAALPPMRQVWLRSNLEHDEPAGLQVLNEILLDLPIMEIRRRRKEMQTLYTEVMMAADPDRGIPFMTFLVISAIRRDPTQTFRQDTLARYLRRRARLNLVREEINRQTIIGFFDTLYWSRRFRQHQRQKQSDKITFLDEGDFGPQLGDLPLLTQEDLEMRATHRLGSAPTYTRFDEEASRIVQTAGDDESHTASQKADEHEGSST
ncbi:hypothetical protein HII31_07525 [Pseudocercospora fuligena]|uniref:Uncharacterized protein n=1 Tax=Pseudocercospora fuligena TaxID=685502 RepID=A0A8H6VLI7_9PEZI|nr:hypothetical protein HII31_07525 [Pseudocercospora fuligena]